MLFKRAHLSERQPEVYLTQVDVLYQNMPFALLSHLLLSPLLVILLWEDVDHVLLSGWLVLAITLVAMRYLGLYRYRATNHSVDKVRGLERYFVLGVFTSGCSWGASGLFVSLNDNPSQWFMVLFFLTGLTGGSLTTLSANRIAFAAFVLPALLPLTLGLLQSGSRDEVSMAAVVFLFITMVLVMSRRTQAFILRSSQLRFEHETLLSELSTKNEALAAQNQQLDLMAREQRHSNELFEKLFHNTHVLYAQLDRDFNFIQVNKAYARAGGKPVDFYCGRNHFDLYPDEDNKAIFQQVVDSGKSCSVAAKAFVYPDRPELGVTYWDWSLRPVMDDEGRIDSLLLCLIDVTEGKKASLELTEKEEYLRSIMETAVDGIITMRADGVIEMVNSAVERIFGYQAEELVGKNIGCLMPDSYRQMHQQWVDNYLDKEKERVWGRILDTEGVRKDGELFPLEVSVSDVLIEGRHVFTGIVRDITEQKRLIDSLQEKNRDLQYLSSHDPLTGLHNRRMADEYLIKEWARARRNQSEIVVGIIDVDHFKAYNDHYGHQAGDDCLRRLARTMSQGLHRPADILARYGGEEFILVLPETSAEGACHLFERIRASIEDLQIEHAASATARHVTVSLGLAAIQPGAEDSYESLVSAADKALYEAKQNGRNRVCCSALPSP